MKRIYSVITGTGSYVPEKKVTNDDFLSHEFYDSSGVKLANDNRDIVDKFLEITTIANEDTLKMIIQLQTWGFMLLKKQSKMQALIKKN